MPKTWYLIDNMRTGYRASRDTITEARAYAEAHSSTGPGDEYIIRCHVEGGASYAVAIYEDGRPHDVPVSFTDTDLRANLDAMHQRALDAEKSARIASRTAADLEEQLDTANRYGDAGEIVQQLKRTTDILGERDEQLDDVLSEAARLRAQVDNDALRLAELEDELRYQQSETAAYARRARRLGSILGYDGLSGAEIDRRLDVRERDRRVISDPPLRFYTAEGETAAHFGSDGSTQGDIDALERTVEYLRSVNDGQRRRYDYLDEVRKMLIEERDAWRGRAELEATKALENQEKLEGVRADFEDLQGVVRHLIQDRDKERARADANLEAAKSWREESKEHEENFKYWVNLAVDTKVQAEEYRRAWYEEMDDSDTLRAELDEVNDYFRRYKEYTQAGFKTLYHEREFGPQRGAPRTERIIHDEIGTFQGEPVRRVLYPVPPVPPERRAVVEAHVEVDTTRFGKSLRAADAYMRDIATAIGVVRDNNFTDPFRARSDAVGYDSVFDRVERGEETLPEGVIGAVMYSDGIPTGWVRPKTWTLQEPIIPDECRYDPGVPGCPGPRRCGCTGERVVVYEPPYRKVGQDTLERRMERGTWE